MKLISFLQNSQLTIALAGEIDHHCARDYIQAINSKIEAYAPSLCILDFQDVTFMDSSGIAVVINSMRSMARMEGRLMLTGMREQPLKVLRTSGVDKLVEFKETCI